MNCSLILAMFKVTHFIILHIVSLLGDTTSLNTVAHYVSMTCDLRETLTARRQHNGVRKKAFTV